jgi:hypothetical protein
MIWVRLLGGNRNNTSNNVIYNDKGNNINDYGCNSSYMVVLVIIKWRWHGSNSKMIVLVTCNYIFYPWWI